MKIFEIFNNKDPYRDTDLPLSNYRGLVNPRTQDNYSEEFNDASELWDKIEDMVEDGIKPRIVEVDISTLLATQDWLSDEPGDGSLFDNLDKYPVVLDTGGKRYIGRS